MMPQPEYSVKRFAHNSPRNPLAAFFGLVYDEPMKPQITEGKEVTVRSAHGEITRIVAKVIGDVVCICRREEFELAKSQGREPAAVGFKMTDVIG